MSLWSFQGARGLLRPTRKAGPRAGLSKLNSVRLRSRLATARRLLANCTIEVDVVLGELDVLTE